MIISYHAYTYYIDLLSMLRCIYLIFQRGISNFILFHKYKRYKLSNNFIFLVEMSSEKFIVRPISKYPANIDCILPCIKTITDLGTQ